MSRLLHGKQVITCHCGHKKMKRMSKENEFLMLLLYKVPVRMDNSSIFF